MRLALAIAAVLALSAGCQGGTPAPPGSSPTPAGGGAGGGPPAPGGGPPGGGAPNTIDACAIGKRVIEQVTPCAAKADAQGWKVTQQAFSTVAGAVKQAGAQTSQVMCAKMLRAVDTDVQHVGCTLDLASAERIQLDALVTNWYAERTPVAPTGDATSDAIIQRVASARDAMCACTDLTCQTAVDHTLDSLGSLPDTASKAARELTAKLIDDMSRCESRVRDLGH